MLLQGGMGMRLQRWLYHCSLTFVQWWHQRVLDFHSAASSALLAACQQYTLPAFSGKIIPRNANQFIYYIYICTKQPPSLYQLLRVNSAHSFTEWLIDQSLHTDKPGTSPSVAHRHGGTCGCHHTTQTKAWPHTPARRPSSQWCLQTPPAVGTHWGLGTGRGLADDLWVRINKECNNLVLKPFWSQWSVTNQLP